MYEGENLREPLGLVNSHKRTAGSGSGAVKPAPTVFPRLRLAHTAF